MAVEAFTVAARYVERLFVHVLGSAQAVATVAWVKRSTKMKLPRLLQLVYLSNTRGLVVATLQTAMSLSCNWRLASWARVLMSIRCLMWVIEALAWHLHYRQLRLPRGLKSIF